MDFDPFFLFLLLDFRYDLRQPKTRVHNRVLRFRLPAHFSLLIPPSRPSLRRNPAVIFVKVILITIKTYLYTMGSKYGTITIRKHALINYVSKDVKSHNSPTLPLIITFLFVWV